MENQIKLVGYVEKATKASDLKEGEVDVIVTTPSWDAYGERILPEGVDFKNYIKNNPVVLWVHDGFNLPIGTTSKMWYEGKKLMARVKFYLADDFPAKVYQYVLDGVVKGVSIGVVINDWGSDGLTITRSTMKELSFCPIPANDDARVAQKNLSTEDRSQFNGLARMYARKCLSKGDDELGSTIKVLKSLTASLEEVALSKPPEDRAKSIHVVLRQAQAVDHQVERVIKVVKKEITNE